MNKLDLTGFETRGGAYSTVIFDKNRQFAYKLFKSCDHQEVEQTDKIMFGESTVNEFRREIFKSEFDAYLKVQESMVLKTFTPTFYGVQRFDQILRFGKDITKEYLMDCCLKLEYIDGDDYKIVELLAYDIGEDVEKKFGIKISTIISEFKNIGIMYLEDASVIVNQNDLKFIDFGIRRVGDYPNID